MIRPMERASTVLLVLVSLPCLALQPIAEERHNPLPQAADEPVAEAPMERQPLAFAWALDPQQAVTEAPPATASSRVYWKQVDGQALQRGIRLPLDAADAVIQITPAVGAGHLAAENLRLGTPSGRMAPVEAVAAQSLQATGMPALEGTLMLRTGPGSGSGAYRLQASQARGQYVVQVLEPSSPVVLEVQADKSAVLAGGSLKVEAQMIDARSGVQRARHDGNLLGQALLVAPDGRSWPQPLARGPQGTLQGTITLPAEGSRVQGLWELQLFTESNGVLRDGKVAFAVAQPTARLQGTPVMPVGERSVAVPFHAARPGRYEVRGTLFATAADGSMKPVAQAHAAAWFEHPGDGRLVLPFAEVALPEGYAAPFELRHLQLRDQAQIAPVETRTAATRL